jgi:hypothetical protein
VNSGSMRTMPLNQSGGPLADGCEPLRLMSMMALLGWRIAALRPAACYRHKAAHLSRLAAIIGIDL